MRRIVRVALLAAAAAGMSACKDLGLRHARDLPYDQAENAPTPQWAYQAADPKNPKPYEAHTDKRFSYAGRTWVVAFPRYALPAGSMRSVGTVDGLQVSALAWDDAPYDQLFVPAGGGSWQAAEPVY